MGRMLATTVLIAGAALHAQTQAPPMPSGTNALVGRLLEVGTDAPVGGAIVTITGQFDSSGKPAPRILPLGRLEPLPSRSVMTTSGGDFVFRDLPAALYTVNIRALGYLNNDFPPTVVELRDSQKPAQVVLRVWKHAAIGGRVVDERGEPVTGVLVVALKRVAAGVALRRAGTGVTDDRGVYRISSLAPGEYLAAALSTSTTLPEGVAAALDPSPANRETFSAMRVTLIQSGFSRTYGCPECISNSHEGYHTGGYVLQRAGSPLPPAPDGRLLGFANTYYPGTSRPDQATPVTLASGESRLDLDLAVRFVPAVSVSGVLTGPDGPVKHVLMSLTPPGVDLNEFDAAGVASAISDGGGAFTFLAVAPGEYRLSSQLMEGEDSASARRSLWASQAVTVGEKDTTDLSIMMQAGVRTSGRVEFRSAAGLVSPPAQRKVITLQPIRAQSWRTLQAVVAPDGTFRSGGDPPGRYILNASSPPGWFWQTTTLGGKPVLDELIELGAVELSGLLLTFGQATNGVTGHVTGVDGAPDPAAAVIVFPADSTTWREGIFSSRRARKVHTTAAGAYELQTLAPGEYYVAAVSTQVALDWQDPQFLERLISGATRVTVGREDEKTVALRTIALARR